MGIAQHCLCLSIGSKFWVNEPHQEIWRYYSNTCPVFWFINRQRTLEQTIFLVFIFFFAQTTLTAFASSAEKSETVGERERETRKTRENAYEQRAKCASCWGAAVSQCFLLYSVCCNCPRPRANLYAQHTHTHRVPISIWLRKMYSQENSFLMRRQLEKKLLDFIHTQIIIRWERRGCCKEGSVKKSCLERD